MGLFRFEIGCLRLSGSEGAKLLCEGPLWAQAGPVIIPQTGENGRVRLSSD